jgi:hypothetical protein
LIIPILRVLLSALSVAARRAGGALPPDAHHDDRHWPASTIPNDFLWTMPTTSRTCGRGGPY